MSLTVEHLDFKITYMEDRNEWQCLELSWTAKSLKDLKAKINQRDAAERRVSPLAVFYADWQGVKSAQVTLVTDDRRQVWVSVGKERKKTEPKNLISDTPENRAVVSEVKSELDLVQKHKATATALLASIPRMTIEDFLKRESVP